MIVTLHTDRLRTLQHVREFLEGNPTWSWRLELRPMGSSSRPWAGSTMSTKGGWKGLLRCFLAKVTGLSRAQLHRNPRRPFPRRYTSIDIGLLAELELHGTLSGATRKLCAPPTIADRRFERLAGISNGHLTCGTRPRINGAAEPPPPGRAQSRSPLASAVGRRRSGAPAMSGSIPSTKPIWMT